MDLFNNFSVWSVFGLTLSWFFKLWFLWMPPLFVFLFWETWVMNARIKFLSGIKWKLLEVRIPRDITKSPKAMEVVFSSLYSGSKENFKSKFKGALPQWYSFEIASINGAVHFFICVQESYRNLLESQIYGQYSDAEIREVPDYATAANFENYNEWEIWGVEIGLSKEDAYPIKTYVDFGLHETSTKEEQKVNPLVSFLELLGSVKDGEQIWFQVMIRGAGSKWVDDGKLLVNKLMGRDNPDPEKKPPQLSKGEAAVVQAVENNIAKLGFETGLRIMYVAKKEVFNKVNIAALMGVLNQYNTLNLNGFKPGKSIAAKPLGFIRKAERELKNKLTMLGAYRKRSYFHMPYKGKSFVFNSEELATIYHFPGRVAETPTFSRIESKKGEPPSNLPV